MREDNDPEEEQGRLDGRPRRSPSLPADRRANHGAERLAGRDARAGPEAHQGSRPRGGRGVEVARGSGVVARRDRLHRRDVQGRVRLTFARDAFARHGRAWPSHPAFGPAATSGAGGRSRSRSRGWPGPSPAMTSKEAGAQRRAARRVFCGESGPSPRSGLRAPSRPSPVPGEGAHLITKFCARTRLQPEAGSCDLFGKPGRKP
jgi:hypothetical protein